MPDLDDVVDVRALTPTQEGMLYHSLAEPETDVFHSQVVTTLPPDLDVDAFQRAWTTLVERHETLRSAFFWDGLDQPLQVVRPGATVPWEVADWSSLRPDALDERLAQVLEEDGFAPFALDEAPLVRMRLFRRNDGHWTWLWTFHHVILDGWSVRVLMRELAELLDGDASSLPEPVSPRRYIDWLAEQDRARAQDHWARELAHVGGPQHLEVPGVDAEGEGHDRVDVTLPPAFAERVRGAAAAQRTTTSALITAAWSLVVSSMTSTADVVVGVTTSGRPPQLAGVEQLVGMFLHTLPLVSSVRSGVTVEEYVADVHRSQLDLVEHQHIGLAEIHRIAGIRGSESLFESIVVVENLPPERAPDGRRTFDDLEFRERSNFPLALLATPGDDVALRLVFDRARFSPVAAERLLRATAQALEQLTVTGLELADLRLVDDDDAALDGPPTDEAAVTVVDAIAEIVRARRADPALATADAELTYGEMWARVEHLAGQLASRGLGRGDRIGVMVPRSIDTIVAILAVLRAGAAYVPLDPGYPRAHLEAIVDDTQVAGVVVGGAVTDPPPVEHLVRVDGTPSAAVDGPPLPRPLLDDVAYVIHTSGSTGRPKGVVVTHDNLAASTRARGTYYREPVGSFLLLSSTSFDSSVAGIFWTLTSGGCLVLPDDGGEKDVDHVHRLIDQRSVTHLLALPSLHRVLAEEVGQLPDTLRCVIVAGEAVDRRVIDAHVAASGARLFNEYGPTEGTVWATVAELTPDVEPRSIGRPIADTRVRIVDHLGRPVPLGIAGELTISGPGVVGGYWDDATATDAAFDERGGRRWYHTGDRCSIGEDGDVLFLGRTDDQLKIRGHRLEPSAVEAALRSSPGVADAAARAVTLHGATTLVGYVEGDVDVEALQADLDRRLPRHMVPGHLEVLDRLPRLPNGKVDGGALPVPSLERDTTRAVPTTETESVLAAIWSDLLGLPDVGVDEDFFDLGGDSILAIKMISQARRHGFEVDPSDAVANPTIRGLAAAADRTAQGDTAGTGCLVTIRSEGGRTPLVCIHAVNGRILPFRNLADHLDRDQPVYAFTAAGLKGDEEPLDSIPAMARRYVDELKAARPDGPYRLLGECFGGSVGLEMARLLEEQGDVVSQVVVIDGALPWGNVRAVSLVAKARRAIRDGGLVEVARGVARRATRRVRQAKEVRSDDPDARFEVYRQRVFEASLAAFGRFTPARVHAPILLIKATEDDRPTGEAFLQPDWADFTSDVVEAYVDTDHLSILKEPGVADVARLVTEHG